MAYKLVQNQRLCISQDGKLSIQREHVRKLHSFSVYFRIFKVPNTSF